MARTEKSFDELLKSFSHEIPAAHRREVAAQTAALSAKCKDFCAITNPKKSNGQQLRLI